MKENSLLKKAIFKINGVTYNELVKNKIIDVKTNTIVLRHKIDKLNIIKNLKSNNEEKDDNIKDIMSNIIKRNKAGINKYNYYSYKSSDIKRTSKKDNLRLSIRSISSNSDNDNQIDKMETTKANDYRYKLMNKTFKSKNKSKNSSINNPLYYINLINKSDSKSPNEINNIKLKLNKKDNITFSKSVNKQYINIKKIEDNPNKHYETIKKYYSQRGRRASMFTVKYSLLSLNVDLLSIMKSNNNIEQLEQLTSSDENYLDILRNSSDNQLIKYSDSITCLINDYKEMIKLGMRMKDFMKSSILLVDSMISNDSSKVFLDNTCYILKCDRASLFIFDQLSDSLVVYSGEGLRRAQIKIPKDKGIVGACFMEAQKCRIDDAYMDQRFNKEIDIKTNYRTKSILCYPLIDNDDKCFGVIEAINKFDSPFNDDDEELLKLLSHQASTIFKNSIFNDDNKFYIKQLFFLIDYCNTISHITNKKEFSDKTEDFLLDFYNCMDSSFFFVENDKIVKYYKDRDEIKEFDNNIGIIGKAYKSKDIIAYENLKNTIEFNSIVDLETSSGLLTFPVLAKKTKNVCAIIQVCFSGEISQGKPKEKEIKIIKKLSKCIKNWIFKFNGGN
jgi:putative methionine-R-sulfoxide reductase with GAF domain